MRSARSELKSEDVSWPVFGGGNRADRPIGLYTYSSRNLSTGGSSLASEPVV